MGHLKSFRSIIPFACVGEPHFTQGWNAYADRNLQKNRIIEVAKHGFGKGRTLSSVLTVLAIGYIP